MHWSSSGFVFSRRDDRRIAIFFLLALILALVWGLDRAGFSFLKKVASEAYEGRESPAVGERNNLQRFTAGRHVLGFNESGMWVAAPDHVLRVRFVGARPVTPHSNQPAPDNGRPQSLERVSYNQLWDGIDLVYESAPGKIVKSTYRLQAGAAVEKIRLEYNQAPQIGADGGLDFTFKTGRMSEAAPVAWQETGGRRSPVAVSFRKISERQVGFSLGAHDRRLPVVIDPSIHWTTFLGAGQIDEAKDLVVLGDTGTVIVGKSAAAWGTPLRAHSGKEDAFVARLNNEGDLVWLTFLGGPEDDEGFSIVFDNTIGGFFVTGESRASWGTPTRAYQGGYDAFVAYLDSHGTLLWHTFLGSTADDYGRGIALSTSGLLTVTGFSGGTWGSPVRDFGGGFDAFVARLDTRLGQNGALIWNTFLGSSSSDRGQAVACTDTAIYVTGYSNAAWGDDPHRNYTGGNDAFLAGLDADGNLEWHTFLGSAADDYGRGITLDESGHIYVVGTSQATWIGSSPPVRAFSGGSDVFLAKFSSSGLMYWNTFLGSAGADEGYDIAVDSYFYIYVTGYSEASWGTPRTAHAGGSDAFLAKVNLEGRLELNTFMGSGQTDRGYAVALKFQSIPYVVGQSAASWGTPRRPCAGSDAFLAVFDTDVGFLWNTFLGGSSYDGGSAIAVDAAGNSYVAGFSLNSWGSPRRAHGTGYDAFVAKLDAQGVLVWNTFLGGSGDDKAYGIVVDGDGNVFVAGESETSWGTSPMRAYSALKDGFLAKLNNSGTLQWHTFLGSAGNDGAYAVALDTGGAPIVSGTGNGTWGVPRRAYVGDGDAFVVKLNSNGNLVWNTFLGGDSSDIGRGLVLDADNNVYLVGDSHSSWGRPVRGHSGDMILNAFAAKLNANGDFQWNTFLGRFGEGGYGIARDSTGNLFVIGYTLSGFHLPIRSCMTNYDAFVAKLDSSGVLLWNTCLGSDTVITEDFGYGIAVDSGGNVYAVGSSRGTWGAPLQPFSGSEDAFLAQLDTHGTLVWNTFLGSPSYYLGYGYDVGYGVAVDSRGLVYVTGDAFSDFGSPVRVSQGNDAFVLRLGGWRLLLPLVVR